MKRPSRILLLAGVVACNWSWPDYALAQSAVWAGGSGNWFGGSANRDCVSGVVLSPCAAPNGSSWTPTIGTMLNGSPFTGSVTANAPVNLGLLAVGTVTGTGSQWVVNETLNVGTGGGNGTLTIANRAQVGPGILSTGLSTLVGSGTGSTGTVLVNGGYLNTQGLVVGGTGGTGTMTVTNGDSVAHIRVHRNQSQHRIHPPSKCDRLKS